MTTPASAIIKDAHTILHDEEGVRWPADELVRYLNMGQVTLVEFRPDQKRATIAHVLTAGHEQFLPDTVNVLFDIPYNTDGKKTRITLVDQQLMDHTLPDWRSGTPAYSVKHFMRTDEEPRKFDVYPPVNSGVRVTLNVGLYPTPIPEPLGATSSAVQGNIDLPDYWQTALLDYVLFRAYSKDAEFGGNVAMAKTYYDTFAGAMAGQLKSSTEAAPKS